MGSNGSRERILDTAERLFAQQGISGTSLRALTREAEVNLAAVHYYFGSKDALLDAVVERRASPVNAERLRALDKLQAEAASAPALEDILAAFINPAVDALTADPMEGQRLARLQARIEAQPPEVVECLFRKHFGDIAARFVDALSGALPHLRKEVVADRFRFAAGLFSFLFSGNFDLDVIPGNPAHAQGFQQKLDAVLSFIAAGMRAPDPAVTP